MKRAIRINYKGGAFEDFEITKAAQIDTDSTVFSLEKGKDGKYRIIFGKKYIEDFSQVVDFEVIREEEQMETDELVLNVDHLKLIPDHQLSEMKKAIEQGDVNNVIQMINNQVLNRELDR